GTRFECIVGSHYLSAPTPSVCFVDSSAPRLPRPYPQHSASFSAPCVLSGWKRGIAGVQAQPPGLRPNPTFSLANSPVSPVDRRRLLTGGLRVGCQELTVFHDSRCSRPSSREPSAFWSCVTQSLGLRCTCGPRKRSTCQPSVWSWLDCRVSWMRWRRPE